MIEYTRSLVPHSIVVAPKLATYLAGKGYTPVPMDAVDYIKKIVDEILARRRNHSERRNDFIQIMVDREEEVKDEEKNEQPIEASREQGTALKKSMSTLCQHHERLTVEIFLALNDKEIFAQAFIFLLAGYETTSVLMSFFFYVMATEPLVQEKVYEEIREQIGDVGSQHVPPVASIRSNSLT